MEWISVKDQLPQDDLTVLCLVDRVIENSLVPKILWRENGKWCSCEDDDFEGSPEYFSVIYWAFIPPLAPSPKE